MNRLFFLVMLFNISFIYPNINEKFIDAIQNNIYTNLSYSNLNYYYQNTNGENFLSLAAYYGRIDLVSNILEQGVPADFRETNGTTPLMNAAFKGHLGIVQLLKSQGADLEAQNIFLYTPLMKAVYQNHLIVVLFLLSYYVNINQQDILGDTALHYAVNYHQNLDIIKALLKKKPNLSLTNQYGLTAFQTAVNKNQVDVVDIFINYDNSLISVLTNAPFLNQLVYNIIISNNTNLLPKLFEIGGSPSSTNKDSVPAIHGASSLGLKSMVSILLDRDSQIIEQTSPYGDTPLTMAVYSEQFDIVQYLTDNNANINHVENNGDTALHIAVRRKNKDITKWLLTFPSINIFVTNNSGDTPFGIAEDNNDAELLNILEPFYNKK